MSYIKNMRMKKIASAAAGVICFVASCAANADFGKFDKDIPDSYQNVRVRINPEFVPDYYYVEAASAAELGESLREMSPVSGNRLRSIAKMSLEVDWKIQARQTASHCELEGAVISSKVTSVQPQWTFEEGTVPDCDVDLWFDFLEALTDYQEMNKKIVISNLEELAEEIKGIRPVKICGELQARVDELGQRKLEKAALELEAFSTELGGGSKVRNLEYPDFFNNPKCQEEKNSEDTETLAGEKE